MGLPETAGCLDLIRETPKERADLAFLFKLLPVLEAQSKGRGYALLNDINAGRIAVTFPLKTLCGRNRGFGRHYESAFGEALSDRCKGLTVIGKREIGSELVYLLARR
jgi:hypothetical protein